MKELILFSICQKHITLRETKESKKEKLRKIGENMVILTEQLVEQTF